MKNPIDYAPATIEMASALLQTAVNDLPAAPTDEELALFACGWLNGEQVADVLEHLVTSPELRNRLIELKAHIAFAQQDRDSQKKVLAAEPVLKTVFAQLLRCSLAAFTDWDKACADTLQGQNESPAVLGSLKELWQSAQRNRQVSYRVATSRSGVSGTAGVQRAKVVVFPGEETADLYIERKDDDVLHAYARFTRPYQHPREICLYMQEEGSGWIRLGGNLTFGSEWRCSVPFISRALDLPVGPLETHYFALTEGRWSGEKRTVLLRITESLSKPNYSRLLRLELRGPANVRSGQFRMRVVLPDEIRREYSDGQLLAGIQLNPTTYIVLGDWKVNQLPEGSEVDLICDLPVGEIPDCDLDYHAGLRLSVGRV